jgi:hypothetical protein
MPYFSTEPQKFACSRRELPGKLFAIAGALLLPGRWSEVLVTLTEVQPKFKIGDLVAEDWVGDDDVAATEFGQVWGMCYFKDFGKLSKTATWEAMLETYGISFPEDNVDSVDSSLDTEDSDS